MKGIPDHLARARIEWIVLFSVSALSVTMLAAFDVTRQWDNFYYDAVVRQAKPAQSETNDILIVAVDDESVEQVGNWPWSRADQARLIHEVARAEPRTILVDVLYADDAPGDDELAARMADAGRVYLPLLIQSPGLNGHSHVVREPVLPLLRSAAGTGHVIVSPDTDGIVRRIDRIYRMGRNHWPHLAVAAAKTERAAGDPDRALLAFAAGPHGLSTVSAAAVINGEVPAELLRNRDIVIGATAAGLGDRFATPFGRDSDLMHGVELVANILAAERGGYWVRPLSAPQVAAVNLLAIVILWLGFIFLPERRSLWLAASLIAGLLVISAALLAIFQIWLAPMAAVLVILLSAPFWGWRRLALVSGTLSKEIASLRSKIGEWQASDGSIFDPLDGKLRNLGYGLRQLSRAHETSEILLRYLPNPTVVVGEGGKILRYNREALLLWLSVVGESDPPPTVSAAFASMRPALSGSPRELDRAAKAVGSLRSDMLDGMNFTTRDDRHFILSTMTMDDVEGDVAMIFSFAEISQLKRAMREKERSLQFLSHDLRSPIAAAIVNLDQALEKRSDAFAAKARALARGALDLAENYVQLAKAEDGGGQASEFDLAGCAEEAIDALWHAARSAGVVLRLEASDEVVFQGHRSSVQRAIGNLVANAILYGSREGDEVRVAVGTKGRGTFFIGVSDRDRSPAPHLAERANAYLVHRKTGNGIGLGLAFCAVAAANHGGDLVQDTREDGKSLGLVLKSQGPR